VRCDGQIITDVVIRSEAPSFGSALADLPIIKQAILGTRTPTAPDVIEHFVLLKKGDRCTPLRRSESERVLRAMPFIADASVTAYPDGQGVRLEVVTVDEPSIVASLGVTSRSPFLTRVTLGSANVGGRGAYAALNWRQGFFYRDVWAGRYSNYQLFEKPYQLHIQGGRRELGSDLAGEISNPFLTDLQRFAWRVSAGYSDEFARFRRPDAPTLSLESRRDFMDVAAIGRIGRPGDLGLLGFQLSADNQHPESSPIIVTRDGLVQDTTSALISRFETFRSVRLNTLIGYRHLRFRRVTGFDALAGPQDLPTGIQLGATVGRSLPGATGRAKQETFFGSSLYLGAASDAVYGALQIDTDARHIPDHGWDDVLSHGRAALYVKPHPRHLLTAELQFAGGWRARVPYQLALGDPRFGIRGYESSYLAGARRGFARVEERWRIANIRDAAEAAVGVFADAGYVSAGDVPFGTSSGIRSAAGVSVMVAAPRRSQRMWRVDFAFPTSRADGAAFQLRLSNVDRTRVFWRAPQDIRRARDRVQPQSVFAWP
jgi:hypothetical protein